MHGWNSSPDWYWMAGMMIGWIVVLAAVVYAAVRIARRPPQGRHTP